MNINDFMNILCCPACRGGLEHQREGSRLLCPACRFRFPIVEGIPILFPCDVESKMGELFTRSWDSPERAEMYDMRVEGRTSIFERYNHNSEVYGLTHYYASENMDLVLDAGCGNARFAETLPNGALYIGADASLNLLKIARRKGRGDFHVCSELEHLPFRDGTFSTVISCRVLQHIPQQSTAIGELCRVARTKGDVILEFYNSWNLKTVYKEIRMSPVRKVVNWPFRNLFRSMSPFDDWGLTYDKYNSWREVKNWLTMNNMYDLKGRGVGFGYHKYLVEPFYINAFVGRRWPEVLKAYYEKCFAVEKAIGTLPPFRYCMEKTVIAARKRDETATTKGFARKSFEWVEERVNTSRLFDRVAILEAEREKRGEGIVVADNRFHLSEAVEWLKRAQDATSDRGVSRGYSVGWNQYFRRRGWQPSYPETTGYIIPTLFDCSVYFQDPDLRERAFAMGDWEISVQMSNGAVMGGTVDEKPSPAVFNTGQVILGWLRSFMESKVEKYAVAGEKAGSFLVHIQNRDGSWQYSNSRFANQSATTYNSRVGWALILLGQHLSNSEFVKAGEKNIEFTLLQQTENGWFSRNSLDNPDTPRLHTICYAIEGILGAGEALNEPFYIKKAQLAADQLLECLRDDEGVPGRLDCGWKGAAEWTCLTGGAQLAAIWLRLFERTRDMKYVSAARRLLRFLKKTQNCITTHPGLRGGIKDAFPFGGGNNKYQVLNWPTKFYIDALLLDERCAIERTVASAE